MSNHNTCTHVRINGVRCGSPALRGAEFCYFHQHAHRGVPRPPRSRLHPIALLESEEAIQASLMEVINALLRNTIDLKRAELILRALHIAVKNTARTRFDLDRSDVVREIPDYAPQAEVSHVGEDPGPDREAVAEHPAPANDEPELDIPYTAMIPPPDYKEIAAERAYQAKIEVERARQAKIRASLERASITVQRSNVGPAAPGCPSGSEVPSRSGPAQPPIKPHDYKQQPPKSAGAKPAHVGADPQVRPSGPASPGRSALPERKPPQKSEARIPPPLKKARVEVRA